MISHVVLFRARQDLSEIERDALVRAFERAVRAIPTVRAVRVGRRVTFGAGYEHATPDNAEFLIAIDFDDLGGLRQYLEHPAHADLGDRFNRACSGALIYDFTVMDDLSGIRAVLPSE